MIRLGVICPSEIAYRRFMPAMAKVKEIEYVGVAYATVEEWLGEEATDEEKTSVKSVLDKECEKCESFKEAYGGKIYRGYEAMLKSGDIDAVYLPLPPSLHYKWALIAIENNLHVFVEKPSTTQYSFTEKLVQAARERKLALHENYMFIYHSQIQEINDEIVKGSIGDVRLIRIDFGFPRRDKNDFRYNPKLGGGALLDCGGYPIRYANHLLGGNAHIQCATLNYIDEFDVDIYGAATLVNDNNMTAQISFGMDNDYRCNIDVWGSKGTLVNKRVLTAPAGYEPSYQISKNGEEQIYKHKPDDAFLKSIQCFVDCINDESVRESEYQVILKQEELIDEFRSYVKVK